MCWNAWVWVCWSCTSPCAVLRVSGASREPAQPSHPGAGVRKERFRGSTVPSDCVCVSIHSAAGQAATWNGKKQLLNRGLLNQGVNHSFVIGTVPKVVFVLQPLQITCLHLSTHTPLPITLGSADWFKR